MCQNTTEFKYCGAEEFLWPIHHFLQTKKKKPSLLGTDCYCDQDSKLELSSEVLGTYEDVLWIFHWLDA